MKLRRWEVYRHFEGNGFALQPASVGKGYWLRRTAQRIAFKMTERTPPGMWFEVRRM